MQIEIKRKELKIHAYIWVTWIVIQALVFPFRGPTLLLYVFSPIQYFGSYIAVFYVTSLYVLPKFWPDKVLYLVGGLFAVFAAYIAFRILIFYYVMPVLGKDAPSYSYYDYIIVSFYWCLQYVVFATAYFAFKRKEQLEKTVTEVEYSFLKAQFNPHFLFNTLSYLYTCAIPVSEDVAKAIMLLSEIMRYSLREDRSDHRVPLREEIDHLRKYIELHQLRNNNEVYINLNVYGDTSKQRILPLLLVSPVENALKYGIIDNPSCPLSITLNVEGSRLEFITKNKKSIARAVDSHGLGHKNLMRRLELAYKGKYQLDIHEEEYYYIFNLTIYDLIVADYENYESTNHLPAVTR